MFVDDGSWASKLNLKDKAQGTAQEFFSIIKVSSVLQESDISAHRQDLKRGKNSQLASQP
ncbi:hypothetical protein BGZ80_004238, partial [Entomortierella chlamydospora]